MKDPNPCLNERCLTPHRDDSRRNLDVLISFLRSHKNGEEIIHKLRLIEASQDGPMILEFNPTEDIQRLKQTYVSCEGNSFPVYGVRYITEWNQLLFSLQRKNEEERDTFDYVDDTRCIVKRSHICEERNLHLGKEDFSLGEN